MSNWGNFGYPRGAGNFNGLKNISVNTFFENIVTDKLALYLDVGNRNSYDGIGSIVKDLVGNNNGSVGAALWYTKDNGGLLNSYRTSNSAILSLATTSLGSTVSGSVWINHTSFTGIQRYITLGEEDFVIRKNTDNTFQSYIKTSGNLRFIGSSLGIDINTWFNIVSTWDGTTFTLYRNAVIIASSVPSGVFAGGNLGCAISAGQSESLDGKFVLASIYDKCLSASEVLQNFNASRNRFGI